MGRGLDEIHPFSDTTGVVVVLRDSERILTSEFDTVGPRNAARIWGFISKFVMLDRFMKTLGLAVNYPGISVPRIVRSQDYFGTALKVIIFLTKSPIFLNLFQILDEVNPPTKVIDRFLRTWGDRHKQRLTYAKTSTAVPTVAGKKPTEITLTLSKSLIAVVKVRNVLHIEAGLEMIALAMAISSNVCYNYSI